jgi:hypothetical protein
MLKPDARPRFNERVGRRYRISAQPASRSFGSNGRSGRKQTGRPDKIP